MIQFTIQLMKLMLAVRHGLRSDETFRALFFLMLSLVAAGTLFYWRVEGWTIVDALYFTVMTMSTIGYGDLAPTNTVSKLFTVVFSLLSVGVFVAVVSKLVAIILERKKTIKGKCKQTHAL